MVETRCAVCSCNNEDAASDPTLWHALLQQARAWPCGAQRCVMVENKVRTGWLAWHCQPAAGWKEL